MLFRLLIILSFIFCIIGNSFSYDKYSPTSEESQQYINKCYRKRIKSSKIQEMIYITYYKNKTFKARFYKEKINEIYFVTDEPFRKKEQIEWVLKGIVQLDYDELSNYYKPVFCSNRSI